MLTDIQFTVSLIFIAIVALYIHRTLKGDYTIVKSELIADGNLKDDHTGRITGNFYDIKTTYKSGRIKYSKRKLR